MRVGLLGALAMSVLPIAVTAAMLWVAAGEWQGQPRLAGPGYRNSAEAAAAGDAASALRLIRMGDNPSRMHPVRPELIRSNIRYVTTLEAALWSRRVEMIRALDREGAIPDPSQRRELACLAVELDMPDAADYLARDRQCASGVIERIIERTKLQDGVAP